MNVDYIASPVEINEEEYLFLSENLDVIGVGDKKSICEFISLSRRNMLNRLTKQAIEEELDEMQKRIIKLLWYDNVSLTKASEILGVNKSTVTRQKQKAYDKLRTSLKYVMLYQFECPKDLIEYFKEAKKIEKRN
jgi:RNA polymerase sigma factor (sigma-70 family)